MNAFFIVYLLLEILGGDYSGGWDPNGLEGDRSGGWDPDG